jgi:hypothetical protein
MAFDATGEKERPEWTAEPDARRFNGMPPAKMDEILLEALEALEQTRKLHESTPNPETKRQARRILTTLHSTLTRLAPWGVHSMRRLQRASVSP